VTDPYRPFGAAPAAFPRTRLERAGVDPATIEQLAGSYPTLPGDEQNDLIRFVTSHSDVAIAERFGAQSEQPAQSEQSSDAVTREDLEALTVDELEERIREWNRTHDEDQHLAVSGRKGELIGRLLDAYAPEEDEEPAEPQPEPLAAKPAPDASTPATGTIPTAPVPTTPEGAPAPAQTAGDAGAAPAPTGDEGTTTAGGPA
jgi:hypothetical protein